MPFSINPDLIENNDVEIQTVDGELALFHKPSGNTLIVDEDTTVSEKLQSPLRDNVDFDGNDLISGGSGEFAALDAESVNTESLNSVVHQSESKGIIEATQEAGAGGTVQINADETVTSDWADALEDGMTFIGSGGILKLESFSPGVDADDLTFIGCMINHSTGIRFLECTVLNILGGRIHHTGSSTFTHALRLEADHTTLEGVTFLDDRLDGNSEDNALRLEDDASNVIVDGCRVEGGIRDDGATNVELGANQIISQGEINNVVRKI